MSRSPEITKFAIALTAVALVVPEAKPATGEQYQPFPGSKDGNTLVLKTPVPSEEAFQRLLTPYRNEGTILKDVVPEIPPNPLRFTTNIGENGEINTLTGTKPLPPNKDTSINDTNILKVNGVVQAEIQGYEPLFPAGISNLNTLAKEYHSKADLIYLLETYYIPGQDQYRVPLVILYVPRSNVKDYTAQKRMELSLPTLVIPDYISSFNMSDDGNSLQIGIKNEIDPIKQTSVDVGLNEGGKATGIVRIKQFLRRLWLSVLLDQSK